MATIGIELCDAGFLTAKSGVQGSQLIEIADRRGSPEWPGFAHAEGQNLIYGRAAEDMWLEQPRRVAHNFWDRLSRDPSGLILGAGAKSPSFSELSFFFLSEFVERLRKVTDPADQLVLALPSAYLKDAATEEVKIGLLLGMADELKLPLAGMIDMACAALCDPRAHGINPALPAVVVDLHLDGADLTLLAADDQRFSRRDFLHLPKSGLAGLMKHLTATMGNRFLRHTAFDILADGRVEQIFFRQTKDFLVGGAAEHRFHINTATRGYEMPATRDQLVADAQGFTTALLHSLQTFLHDSPHASTPCTIALTDRAAHLPGFEARLRSAGYARLVRLPRGAAACGAASIGAGRMEVLPDLSDVPLETAVPLTDVRRLVAADWDARLQKLKEDGPRVPPTHAILGGIGHPIGRTSQFTIGPADAGANLILPPAFNAAEDCAVRLVQEDGRLWFVDSPGRGANGARTSIEAGDRLMVQCGTTTAEVIFAHCPSANGIRMD
jgi:hypothetical protein